MMKSIEEWIKLIAVVSGILAVGLPLIRLWSTRNRQRGRESGNHLFATKWPGVFLLTVLFVLVGISLWTPIPLEFSQSIQLVLTLLGCLFYFPGIFFYLWGLKTLGPMFGVSSASAAQLYEDHRLVEDGPYATVRHPMYLGVFLTAIGALLIFRTWAMVLFTPSAFGILIRARREEKLLANEFGEVWTEYAARVPGWFPKLGKRKTK